MMLFSTEHLWMRISEDGASAVAGLTVHAQQTLGDIVFIELPRPGRFEESQVAGLVESSKTASDLFMPVAGRIVKVNAELGDRPELLNNDPQGTGWIFTVEDFEPAALTRLMSEPAYQAFVGR